MSKPINQRVASLNESVFGTISKLSIKNNAINLGQGFPDFDGPEWLTKLASEALLKNKNQYAPAAGIAELRSELSALYSKEYQLKYSEDSEITVTTGATEGIFCSILATLNPEDEVIVFEPFYDSYLASIELAGAKAIPITLKFPDFKINNEEFSQKVNSKTKMVIINNPHNPTGRVFSREELIPLTKTIKENNLLVLSDEVYEFLTYDGHLHTPFASLPDMKERTYTVSSLGKTFGLTGWKVGWVCAPRELTDALRKVKQYTTYCTNHPMQIAAAQAIQFRKNYLVEFKETYSKKKNFFVKEMKNIGFNIIDPQGTYFALIKVPETFSDISYCQHLIKKHQVSSIPPSAFYLKSNEGEK
ncbi:aminotransferase class I/II-fold pyridoxal phosphate-dependent enzyme, partial [Bacteriovoracaceae bacterium]|nr:aminotransferase class I/II-fold pyridoxal phosphate-dependent enzyme [Bacteriovoracaceae bacterium]